MRDEKFLISAFLFLIVCFSACEKQSADEFSEKSENSENLSAYSRIEDVDFRNFSYSSTDFENKEYKFTLTNGEKPYGKVDDSSYRLRSVQYKDLTKDGKNEAVVNLYVGLAVSSTSAIFIYTLESEQPKRLWYFYSGTFANGGLKDIYVKENNLIAEFFGNTKFDENKREFVFPEIYKYPETECCPKKFTKLKFEWRGEKFILAAKPELLDYKREKECHENLFCRNGK